MFSSVGNYLIEKFGFHHHPLSKEEREKVFPKCTFQTNPVSTRKIGLSTNEIYPLHIYGLIEKYYDTLDNHNHRYEWMKHWLPAIKDNLVLLNQYTLSDVGRLVIIQNERVIFDFYLIYDIHIQDIEYVVINLDQYVEPSSLFSKIFTSLIFSFQNIFRLS